MDIADAPLPRLPWPEIQYRLLACAIASGIAMWAAWSTRSAMPNAIP